MRGGVLLKQGIGRGATGARGGGGRQGQMGIEEGKGMLGWRWGGIIDWGMLGYNSRGYDCCYGMGKVCGAWIGLLRGKSVDLRLGTAR